jgi:hypothetical protein
VKQPKTSNALIIRLFTTYAAATVFACYCLSAAQQLCRTVQMRVCYVLTVAAAAAAAAAVTCRFELAIQLGDLETAADIANTLDTPVKWRQLGERETMWLQ